MDEVFIAIVVYVDPRRAVAVTVDDLAVWSWSDPVEFVLERAIALVDVERRRRAEVVAKVVVHIQIDKAIAVRVAPVDAVAQTGVGKSIAIGILPMLPEAGSAFLLYLRQTRRRYVAERCGGCVER